MKHTFSVPGMSCNHCKMRISGALKGENITDFTVDLGTKKVSVNTDKKPGDIAAVLEKAGYSAKLEDY